MPVARSEAFVEKLIVDCLIDVPLLKDNASELLLRRWQANLPRQNDHVKDDKITTTATTHTTPFDTTPSTRKQASHVSAKSM